MFLDTTYCDPKYVFPPQKDTINFIADRVDVHAQQDPAEQKGIEYKKSTLKRNCVFCFIITLVLDKYEL